MAKIPAYVAKISMDLAKIPAYVAKISMDLAKIPCRWQKSLVNGKNNL